MRESDGGCAVVGVGVDGVGVFEEDVADLDEGKERKSASAKGKRAVVETSEQGLTIATELPLASLLSTPAIVRRHWLRSLLMALSKSVGGIS